MTYMCTVTGSGFTLWQGSVFNCSGLGNEILLPHSDFNSNSGTIKKCNSGAIVGSSLDEVEDHYSSQLTINVRSEMNNETVECAYLSGATSTAETIGTSTIRITTGELCEATVTVTY